MQLLFGVPLPAGGLITAAVAFALLTARGRGHRPFEVVVGGLLGVIGAGFLYDVVFSGVDPGALAGGLLPSFAGTQSIVLATGILGATVMPHVIYVHSALSRGRYVDEPLVRPKSGQGSRPQPDTTLRHAKPSSVPNASTSCSPWGPPASSTPRC